LRLVRNPSEERFQASENDKMKKYSGHARLRRTSQSDIFGTNCELETQIMLSYDLGYITIEDMKKLQKDIGEVKRMLKALIGSLENKNLNP
jgi:hypothetical protein